METKKHDDPTHRTPDGAKTSAHSEGSSASQAAKNAEVKTDIGGTSGEAGGDNPRPVFFKVTAERRNTSDLFLNSNDAAWSQQIPLGDTGYADAIAKAIRQVNDEWDDRARAQGKEAPAPSKNPPKK
jgi:hypothetical protein